MATPHQLVVDQACANGALRRAQIIQQLHESTFPWHITRALPALGNVKLDVADLGTVPAMATARNGLAIVTLSQHLVGTPLEGAALALAAAHLIMLRTREPRACACPHSGKEWTVAARLAVPDSMVNARRERLICATTIEQQTGVPLALVKLRLAITPTEAMYWGTQRYLDARAAALAEWQTWLSGAAGWARRRVYDHVLSDRYQEQSA